MGLYVLKSSSISSLTLFFFKVVLAILGILHFHMNFRISLSILQKETPQLAGVLIGIVLNLPIILGEN